MKKSTIQKAAGRALLYISVLIVLLPVVFPIYFVIISSLKNMADVYRLPPQLFNFEPIFKHYEYIFGTQNFGRYMLNSAIIALASTCISMVMGVPAAYSVARFNMAKTSASILTARLLPNISILLPYYYIFSRLRMIDTYWVLIISHIVLAIPLIVWIMAGFISDIPYDLEEAARVDGATRQRCFMQIILPVSSPGIVTCATLSFLNSWNNFQFALILGGDKTRTLPVSLQSFVSGSEIKWGRMLAATVVVIIPTVFATMILQKYIVKGLTAGAVKG